MCNCGIYRMFFNNLYYNICMFISLVFSILHPQKTVTKTWSSQLFALKSKAITWSSLDPLVSEADDNNVTLSDLQIQKLLTIG